METENYKGLKKLGLWDSAIKAAQKDEKSDPKVFYEELLRKRFPDLADMVAFDLLVRFREELDRFVDENVGGAFSEVAFKLKRQGEEFEALKTAIKYLVFDKKLRANEVIWFNDTNAMMSLALAQPIWYFFDGREFATIASNKFWNVLDVDLKRFLTIYSNFSPKYCFTPSFGGIRNPPEIPARWIMDFIARKHKKATTFFMATTQWFEGLGDRLYIDGMRNYPGVNFWMLDMEGGFALRIGGGCSILHGRFEQTKITLRHMQKYESVLKKEINRSSFFDKEKQYQAQKVFDWALGLAKKI